MEPIAAQSQFEALQNQVPPRGLYLATSPDPMPFCSRKARNPLRLRGFSAAAMKSDPMRSGKNPGREF
jgi:hypothetical protein